MTYHLPIHFFTCCHNNHISASIKTVEPLKSAKKALSAGDLTKYLQFMETKLLQQGGSYFADQKLTIADLKIMTLLTWLNAGALDHIPTDMLATVAPKLNEYFQKIIKEPSIVTYYAEH